VERFSEEDRATIWDMRESGVPVKRIASHLGRHLRIRRNAHAATCCPSLSIVLASRRGGSHRFATPSSRSDGTSH
jgi:hypothetical protein